MHTPMQTYAETCTCNTPTHKFNTKGLLDLLVYDVIH